MIQLYAALMYCASQCSAGTPPPSGLLLYSSKEDCEQSLGEMSKWFHPPTGIVNICTTIYFADYAQVERLIYGRVTCYDWTQMPESVMARTLTPHGQYCKEAKP